MIEVKDYERMINEHKRIVKIVTGRDIDILRCPNRIAILDR